MKNLDQLKQAKLQQKLHDEQLAAQAELKDVIKTLNETINGQEPVELDKLYNQLKEITELLDLKPLFTSLEESLHDISQTLSNKTNTPDFSKLTKVLEKKQVVKETVLDLRETTELLEKIREAVERETEESQNPEDFKPVRRVVKVGNRLLFDDQPTSVARGGGGGINSELTRNSNTAIAVVNPDGTNIAGGSGGGGDASAANQTSGNQKTQIVDSGGEAATVTGGKLDVNASVSIDTTGLATDTKQDEQTALLTSIESNQLPDGHNVTIDNGAGVAAVNIQDGGNTITVDGTVGVTGVSTAAKQDTIISHIDGLEASVDQIEGYLDGVETTLTAIEGNQLPDGHNVTVDNPGDIGGGTQYSDGDANADPTGTVAMGTDGTNVFAVHTDTAGDLQVDVLSSALPSGASTSAKQDTGNTSLASIDGKITAVNTGAVTVASSALPTGAATSAKQDTVIGHLDGVEGLLTDIEADTDTLAVVGSGTEATAQRVTIATDSTGVLSVDDNGSSLTVDNAGLTELAAAINSDKVDVNIASSGIALGGTSAADDADFTAGTTPGTPSMGVYESTPTSVTDGDLGTVGITAGRRLKTSATIDAALPAGNNNIGDVDVASSALPSGASTSANQSTIIGHLDGVEGLLTTIDGDTGNISTKIDTLAGAVAGTEVQVDVLTMPTTTVQATNLDVRDIDQATDDIRVYANTAKDGSGTAYVPLVDTDGHLQIDVLSMPAGGSGLTDAELRATPVPVSGTVTADLGATDNAVLDAIAASTAAIDTDTTTLIGHVDGVETLIGSTNTKLDTTIGHLDGVEGLLTTIAGDTTDIEAAVELIDDTVATLGTTTYTEASTKGLTIGAVRRDANTTLVDTTNEVAPLQVNATGELKVAQIQALPAGTNNIGDVDVASIAAGDNNIGNVDIVTVPADPFGANADAAVAAGATGSIQAKLRNLTSTNDSIKTAVETIDNAISGNEMQVDVVAALPAGTNAIGKLAANSGVDIGDVDVTSAVSATLDHGSNQDIDTAAEQITSTSFACKFGVTLRADAANTGTLYIGNSDVTVSGTAATDGIPLYPGDTLFLPVTNSNIPYAIASANNQKVFWVAV